jgi:poly(A) polymerase
VAVGAAFGVVRVLGEAPAPGAAPPQVEVASFRWERGYADGRHPDEVGFSDEVEDVKRRDFTVNGLLYDPLKDEVLDYVGGRRDLAARKLRAIGDPRARFQEDRLRLLRAVRFAAALDFEIEANTYAALKKEAPQVTGVSPERIRDELTRMLTGPRPRRALELLKATRLLHAVLPEVDALAGVEQPLPFHPEGDVWTHTLLMLEELSAAPLALALGVLLHDIGKPLTFERAPDRIRFNEHEKIGAQMSLALLRRFRFPNQVVDQVTELVRWHMLFKDIEKMRPAKLKRFLRRPDFELHLELHRLDCLASHGDLKTYRFCLAQRAALPAEQLRPTPLLTGEDLKALGLAPGPLFKRILADVEDRQLEGALRGRDEALDYVRRNYRG